MSKKENWQKILALACVILGILIALQFRTQKNQGFPLYHNRNDELIRIINNLEKERNQLQFDLKGIRERLKSYEENFTQGKSLTKNLKEEIENLRLQTGLEPLAGPGLVIKLSDSSRKPKINEDPYFFLIHDMDLQVLVNELLAGGAEVISINEQRIINRTSPPYEIKAIGPSTNLEAVLRMPGGFLDSLTPYILNGIKIKIFQTPNTVIPAYKGSLAFRYAKKIGEKK
ncbi:MAG: DUF881 domain-containing protein [Armatimonadetes bacterium]|nr:DUF881 domain-containing protein [Armatimonadota bacterium]